MKMHIKRADGVRKISFRYRSVTCADGIKNIFIQKALQAIFIKSSS
jgi:hypothetical protein